MKSKKPRKLKSALIVIIMLPLILTSCWDQVEINELAFINAIFIDKNITENKSDVIASKIYTRDPEDLFVTFGIANASEGETNLKTFTHSVSAVSLRDAEEKLDSEITRNPFFGHTKLIIFATTFLKDSEKVRTMLDSIERYTSIDREIKIIAADNSNIALEGLRPKTETLYSSYVSGVMKSENAISFTVSMKMGEFFEDMRKDNGKGVLPLVRIENDKIKLDKMVLMNNYELKQIVNAREIRGYKLFKGENTGIREYAQLNDTLTGFKLSSLNRKITYIKGGDVPKFHISYTVKGGVENYDFEKMIFTNKNQTDLQEEVEYLIKGQLAETADYFQNKIGIDYLGLDDYTSKFHPSEFKKYKNWDEAFQKAEISYDVDVALVRYDNMR